MEVRTVIMAAMKDVRVLSVFIVLAAAVASYTGLAYYEQASSSAYASNSFSRTVVRTEQAGSTKSEPEESHRKEEQTNRNTTSQKTARPDAFAGSQSNNRGTGATSPSPSLALPEQPAILISQFKAIGCERVGASTLRYHDQTGQWDNYRQLAKGATGECVKSLQRKLNTYCKNKLEVDGIFGPLTERAVRAYKQHMKTTYGHVSINGGIIGDHMAIDGVAGFRVYALMQHFSATTQIQC